jgi:ribosomal protein L11 methyltransferase
LLATHDNAERNGVGDRLAVYLPDDEPVATYPVVVANILAKALVALADTLAARVAPGGRIAMSGILAGQEHEVIARYADTFDDLRADRLEDWIRVTGIRRG